jgi:hypothetical protein
MVLACALVAAGFAHPRPAVAAPEFKTVAVVIFPQNATAKRYANSAQSRIEMLLADNGITVFDQKKAAELKNVWKKLEDPGYFVTAEDFVKNAGKFSIDGVLRVYLMAESTKSIGQYFSATAIADLRLVDENAKSSSFATVPMGVPGRPPSDGLTESAAIANAVQRAVDEAAGKVGLQVMDYTSPRLLKFNLEGPVALPANGRYESNRAQAPQALQFASLKSSPWVKESVTCQDADRSGGFSVVGGYVFSKAYGEFSYWAQLHLVDVKNGKEVLTYGPLEKEVSESGTSKVIDCMFVKNWRYVVALTEHSVFMWDTERNVVVSSTKTGAWMPEAKLAFVEQPGGDDLIAIVSPGGGVAYKLVRE